MANLRKSTLGLLALDTLSVALCFNLALHLRGLTAPTLLPLIWPALFAIAALYLIDGYNTRADMLSLDYASQHLIAHFCALLGTLLILFVFRPAVYDLTASRGVILSSFAALAPLTLAYRRLAYSQLRKLRQTRPLLFIGSPDTCRAFQTECLQAGLSHPLLLAHTDRAEAPKNTPAPTRPPQNHDFSTDTSTATAPDAALPPLAPPPQDLAALLGQVESETLSLHAIILGDDPQTDLPAPLAHRQIYFDGVPIYTRELFHQVYWRKVGLHRLDHKWPFQEGFAIAREPVFEHIKRLTDIFLASLGLLLALPLMLLCALAIWLEDRGPVLFTQTRIGQNRRPFKLYKLRTMRVRPPTDADDKYTRPGDARITRIGRLLRTTRLDEFPQLLNVLFGDMSMIGPRAEWDELVQNYETEIPCYHFRHLLKPGITGWAQVNYPYGANLQDTLRKLEYDLYYIRHFSFRLDAAIILKTIHIMLFGRGR